MKRQRFLARQGSGCSSAGGARDRRPAAPSINTDISSSMVVEAPTSPLAELLQQGYPATGAPRAEPEYAHGPPAQARASSHPPPGMYGGRAPSGLARSSSRQDGFDADVAQQWSGNVQRSIEQHQQQNDPNYRGCYKKPSGYRVSHAPGGGSSLSLSWGGDADQAAAAPVRGGAGNRAPSPSYGAGALGQRAPSPSHAAAGRGAQRSQSPFRVAQANPSPRGSGMAAALGGGPASYSTAAAGRAGPPSYAADARPVPFGSDADTRFGAGGSAGGSRDTGVGYGRPPVPRASSREGGMPGGMGMHGGMGTPSGMGNPGAHGARVDNRSSNAFACGANQNSGNYVSDRRTTRVARPPGGGSSIVFG